MNLRSSNKMIRIRNPNNKKFSLRNQFLTLNNILPLTTFVTVVFYTFSYFYNILYFSKFNIPISQIELTIQDTIFASYIFVPIQCLIIIFVSIILSLTKSDTVFTFSMKTHFIVINFIMYLLIVAIDIYLNGYNSYTFNYGFFVYPFLILMIYMPICRTPKHILALSLFSLMIIVIPLAVHYEIKEVVINDVNYIENNNKKYHLLRTLENGFFVLSDNYSIELIFKDGRNTIDFGHDRQLQLYVEMHSKDTPAGNSDIIRISE